MTTKDTITISREEYFRLQEQFIAMKYIDIAALRRIHNNDNYQDELAALKQQIFGDRHDGA